MIIIISFILLLVFSCNTPQKYEVTGVIKDIELNNHKILIDHDNIPGFMDQMVMYFNVHTNEQISSLSINDSVSFTLIINDKQSYTTNYNKLGISKKSTTDDNLWFKNEDSKYSLKMPGEYINDGTFLDLNNKKIKLSELTSDISVISFIFSRCPMPNMCPAVIVKNQYLANYFKDKNINFILVSFDYLFDTPTVLKNVYGSINNEKIFFLSSYKHLNDIISLTQQAGVGFWGVEDNNIGHSMRTIIIDKDLKLLKTFDGEDWKPADAKNSIQNLLKVIN